MATQTSILKSALDLLGEADSEGIDDDTEWVARITDRFSDVARSMFEDHPWNFATEVEQLQAVTPAIDGWDYTFSEPAGCYRILRVSNTARGASNHSTGSIDYEQRAGKILTNHATTYCAFVSAAYLTQYGSWPQKVADLLGALLAERVYPVQDKRDATARRIEMAVRKCRRDAKVYDASAQPAPPRDPGSWHRSRTRGIGGGTWR